jgi:hypothetical protein
MSVSNVNEPMLIGDEGYTKVVDKDGNVYTWMKQDVISKLSVRKGQIIGPLPKMYPVGKRVLYQYLKDSSGKEKKVFNMTFKENYSKLVIQRPDARIGSSYWDGLSDEERSKFIYNWDKSTTEWKSEFLTGLSQ